MKSSNNFQRGDRVRVISGPSKQYIGLTGTITESTYAYNHVNVDKEWRRNIQGNPDTRGAWDFYKRGWQLELETPTGPEPYEEWFKA